MDGSEERGGRAEVLMLYREAYTREVRVTAPGDKEAASAADDVREWLSDLWMPDEDAGGLDDLGKELDAEVLEVDSWREDQRAEPCAVVPVVHDADCDLDYSYSCSCGAVQAARSLAAERLVYEEAGQGMLRVSRLLRLLGRRGERGALRIRQALVEAKASGDRAEAVRLAAALGLLHELRKEARRERAGGGAS